MQHRLSVANRKHGISAEVAGAPYNHQYAVNQVNWPAVVRKFSKPDRRVQICISPNHGRTSVTPSPHTPPALWDISSNTKAHTENSEHVCTCCTSIFLCNPSRTSTNPHEVPVATHCLTHVVWLMCRPAHCNREYNVHTQYNFASTPVGLCDYFATCSCRVCCLRQCARTCVTHRCQLT
jgi:hypothetical protein